MRVRRLDIADPIIAAAASSLQRRAYRLEADLIGTDAIPPLAETLEELQAVDETFLGAWDGSTLAGLVSWRVDGTTIDVHRLAVDPEYLRRGVATLLLRNALAAEPRAARAVVQTGAANEPAKALYRREGFRELRDCVVGDGVLVTQFEKRLPSQ